MPGNVHFPLSSVVQDIADDLMPDKEQAQVRGHLSCNFICSSTTCSLLLPLSQLQRFMDRTLLPPVCVVEDTSLPHTNQPQPDVSDNAAAISTLPPHNVDSGRYGSPSLLALQFSNTQPQPPAVVLEEDIPGTPGPTQVQEGLPPSHHAPQSGGKRRRRKKVVVRNPLSQIREQTLMVYQEFPPIRSPPRPYSPLVQVFTPEFTPLRGTRVVPPDTPTPHFPPPAVLHQVGQPRPAFTQFYAVVEPKQHPLPPRQPSHSGIMGAPSSGSDLRGAQEHRRLTSLLTAPYATQARLSNMASIYSPALAGFVPMPHANDPQCLCSPYSVEMPPLVNATHQPYFESRTRAMNVDTLMDRQMDALWDTAQTRASGMDQIVAGIPPAFRPPSNHAAEAQMERRGVDAQPSHSLPAPQISVMAYEAPTLAPGHGGIRRERCGERRQPVLPPAETPSPKQARMAEPLRRAPRRAQREHRSASSVVHEVPLSAADQGQESTAEVALSALPRTRTKRQKVIQLPPEVQPRQAGPATTGYPSERGGHSSASGDPASGQAGGQEEGVDIVNALRRCSFPSTQFSTLLQVLTYPLRVCMS